MVAFGRDVERRIDQERSGLNIASAPPVVLFDQARPGGVSRTATVKRRLTNKLSELLSGLVGRGSDGTDQPTGRVCYYATPKHTGTITGIKNDPVKLADYLGLNLDLLIRREIDGRQPQFSAGLTRAADLVARFDPAAVVYDIEFVPKILAVLLECKSRGVPIISMQHASGFAEQYKGIPILGDYYIAYSDYTRSALMAMGVDSDRIVVSGVPEPAPIAVTRSQFGFPTHKKLVLVPLKPMGLEFEYYTQCNITLLENILTVFSGATDFHFLIRPHPINEADPGRFLGRAMIAETELFSIDETAAPIESLLKVSDYCLSFMSTCLLQAVTVGTPICIVTTYGSEHAIWPPWDKYKVADYVSLAEISDWLTKMKTGIRPECESLSESERSLFIKEFGQHHDVGYAIDISNKIIMLTA